MNNFLYPHAYSPGQFAMAGNPELSTLITMFGGPLIAGLAGPNNFAPHLNPGQNLMDQFVMRNYQNQMRKAYMNLPAQQQPQMANTLLGMRAAVTNSPATDYNREQAMNMAGMLNNPITKTILGSVIGPENLEAMFYGSRGDVQALGGAVNRMGYFRRDPGGGRRMDAESLEDLTTGIFSHLYAPQGDLDALLSTARAAAGADRGQQTQAITRLRNAAKTNKKVVDDTELTARLDALGADQIQNLYTKYVQGGEETDTAAQIKALTKFDNAIASSRVLGADEISLAGLKDAAQQQPVKEMHGFRAGQVAQITQHLNERGILPPTIGRLSAEQQVQNIAETGLDDATLDRLARTAAERAILARNDDAAKEFQGENRAGKNRLIDQELARGDYRGKIENTFNDAQAVARGESKKSAEEVLQQLGGEALVSNVDASRVGGKLKDYSKAVSAVRDIFGDNGNPNAPMPALLAVLDQLTQGGMHQMGAEKAGNVLRQMQGLARDTGTGMQQLAAMSSYAGGIGRQLGVAPSITMQNVANTLGITRSMMDAGTFSSGAFGSLSKEEMQLQLTKELQESDASQNAKAMASLAAIYAQDPDKYAGTELEQFVKAYNDPATQGAYTFDGEKKNVYDLIGQRSIYGAREVLENSGGDLNQLEARYYDPRTMEFAQAGAGFLTRKAELVDTLSAFSTDGFVSNSLSDQAIAGLDTGDYQNISNTLTELTLDTSNMNLREQVTAIQNNAEDRLTQQFQKTKNLPEKEARALAAQVITNLNLDDRGTVDKMVGNMGVVSQDMTGAALSVQGQKFGGNIDRDGFTEAARQRERAKRAQEYGGTSTLAGRVVDYFTKIGESGEAFNLDELVKAAGNFLPTEELRQQFAGVIAPGLKVAADLRDTYRRSEDDIRSIQDDDKLKALANITNPDNTIVVSDEDIVEDLNNQLSNLDPDQVTTALEGLGVDTAGMSPARQKDELIDNQAYKNRHRKEYLDRVQAQKGNADKSVITRQQLVDRAVAYGTQKAKDGQEDLLAAATRIETGLLSGANENLRRTGLRDIGKIFEDQVGGAENFKKIQAAVLSTAPDAEKQLATALGFKDVKTMAAAADDVNNEKADLIQLLQAYQKGDKFDLANRGVRAADPAAKQKTDRMNVEAPRVDLRADKVEITGAADQLSAVQAEIKELREKRTAAEGLVSGLFSSFSEKDAARLNDLEKKEKELTATTTAAMPDQMRPKEAESRLNELRGEKHAALAGASPLERGLVKAELEYNNLLKKKETGTFTEIDAKKLDAQRNLIAALRTADIAELDHKVTGAHFKTTFGTGMDSTVSVDGHELDYAAYVKERKKIKAAEAAGTPRISARGEKILRAKDAENEINKNLPQPRAVPADNTSAAAGVAYPIPANINARMQQNPTVQFASVGAGGGQEEQITIGGRIKLDGLHEAIAEFTSNRRVSTPSGGPTIVKDPPPNFL